jgi:DNA modification methylase
MKLRDRIRELRRVKASELRPNPKNWRTHPQAQQDALRGVLAEVGIADALLARELDDGSLMLVDGHLRADTDPSTEWPVLILDVSEAEADKLLATFDPLAGMAEADPVKLDELLREIDTGSEALQKMLAELADDAGLYKGNGEVVEDEVPEPPVEPVTKPGDLWLLGEHRLLCGDSTKAEDVGRVLDGRKPFIMVTDPPYGVEYDADWRNEALRADGSPSDGRAVGKVSNDDKFDWTESYQLFSGHVAYVWHAGRFSGDVARSIEAAKFEIRCQLIWVKSNFAIGRGHYHWGHEPCWYAVRSGGSAKWGGDRTQSTAWNIAKPSKSETGHSTQKPVECMARPIRNHGGKDDDVYDPFLGSGTTIIAAEQLGRRCFGLELEPRYCDVILTRWAKLTGKTPINEATGEPFPVSVPAAVE